MHFSHGRGRGCKLMTVRDLLCRGAAPERARGTGQGEGTESPLAHAQFLRTFQKHRTSPEFYSGTDTMTWALEEGQKGTEDH